MCVRLVLREPQPHGATARVSASLETSFFKVVYYLTLASVCKLEGLIRCLDSGVASSS